MPNVKIGENYVIGAGSIVTKNISTNSVVAGNPAHILMTLDVYISKCEKRKPHFSNITKINKII